MTRGDRAPKQGRAEIRILARTPDPARAVASGGPVPDPGWAGTRPDTRPDTREDDGPDDGLETEPDDGPDAVVRDIHSGRLYAARAASALRTATAGPPHRGRPATATDPPPPAPPAAGNRGGPSNRPSGPGRPHRERALPGRPAHSG